MILTARVFTTVIFASGFSPPWILTAVVFASGVFSSVILATGLFLRDGQIDGVGTLLKRHVEECGFGDRSGELTVDSPSEVKMR